MSTRREQTLSLELEEQQAGTRLQPSFISYMGGNEASRMPVAMAIREHQEHYQQYTRVTAYPEASQVTPNRQLPEGFFWPTRPHFTAQASYMREFRHQQQEDQPEQQLPKLMRSSSEMALNVRGMNVVPLPHRPPVVVVAQEQQQQPIHHHVSQLQLQQQMQLQLQQEQQTANLSRAGSGIQSFQQIQEQQVGIHLQQQMQLVTSSSSTASGGSTCKECGNQAKKDCVYQRCRTCCKSRGFECATHVRSTWVPAAKRRERQLAEAAAIASGQPRPKSKRNRAIAMQQQLSEQSDRLLVMDEDITAVTPTATTTSNSPHSDARQSQTDLGSLPSEVRAQAVFKCVKVTRVDNGEDEYAYQAVVRIGGRVFKGVLQDQGADVGEQAYGGGPSISGDTTSLGDLQLGGAAVGSTAGGTPPQMLQLDPGSNVGMFGGSSQASEL